jgi:hypothetical protein
MAIVAPRRAKRQALAHFPFLPLPPADAGPFPPPSTLHPPPSTLLFTFVASALDFTRLEAAEPLAWPILFILELYPERFSSPATCCDNSITNSPVNPDPLESSFQNQASTSDLHNNRIKDRCDQSRVRQLLFIAHLSRSSPISQASHRSSLLHKCRANNTLAILA